jgi:hypothetical protein
MYNTFERVRMLELLLVIVLTNEVKGDAMIMRRYTTALHTPCPWNNTSSKVFPVYQLA